MALRTICVYCGARHPIGQNWASAARAFGALLAEQDMTLVYGGGNVGLMGSVADGCLQAGGHVIGVMPRHLVALEISHRGLDSLIQVETMHERKALMAELSDGFVALPGGLGTLEEITEAMTWTQLGLHLKPSGMLNVDGFFDPFIALVGRMVDVGFVDPRHAENLCIASNPRVLLAALKDWKPVLGKWEKPTPT